MYMSLEAICFWGGNLFLLGWAFRWFETQDFMRPSEYKALENLVMQQKERIEKLQAEYMKELTKTKSKKRGKK